METYDVIVLGGGSAGTSAAREAAAAGARTALFNAGELGGLCILRGCMPTKTMLHAAHHAHAAAHHEVPGVRTRLEHVDFAAVMRNKDVKVRRFQRAKLASIEAGGYDVIDARVRFADGETVAAEDGRRWRFARGAVIATGSVPLVPEIEGLDTVRWMSSDDVMCLERRPASLAVVGSGAIGLELAQFFARMGTRVHLVSRRRVFAKHDPLLALELEAVLRAEPGLELLQPVEPRCVRPHGEGVELELADGERVVAEGLVLATGREPAVADLGLDAVGVRVRGTRIESDGRQATSNKRIWVAGDATGERQLLHVANWEGWAAGWNAAGGEPERSIAGRVHVEVVFTDPPVALVGLTEREARALGEEVVTATARLPETGRAITMEVLHGAMKLVAREADGALLGAQLVGPSADEIVHTLAALIHLRAGVRDMLEMPWYHPTLTEVLLSLARDLAGRLRPARVD